MPIVTPGKRPAKRFEKSRILGGKMVKGRKATNAELNVVPMVDMMTMLVIFLLQQFSSTGEVMYMQKDIKLPDAQHGQMIEVAPVVAISAQQVVVTGVKVADIADLEVGRRGEHPGGQGRALPHREARHVLLRGRRVLQRELRGPRRADQRGDRVRHDRDLSARRAPRARRA